MSEPTSPNPAYVPGDIGSLDRRFNTAFLAQKRAASRHQMPSQITVEYVECYEIMRKSDKRFWVTTRDVSRTGISFFHFDPMYHGERIRLELRLDRGKLRYVDATVARCRRLHNGQFEVGVAFSQHQEEAVEPKPDPARVPDIPWIYR